MEINLNNAISNTNPATSSNVSGNAAAQNIEQRADVAATRVVSAKESANLENQAASSEQKRFENVKSSASRFISGANPFLNDVKFTIYGQSNANKVGEYTIRFTDLGTGKLEVKTEQQLASLVGTGGGNIVSGQI